MKVNAYGRDLELRLDNGRWRVYDLGSEGKKRPAADIRIPAGVSEEEVVTYLADLLHEYASERHPRVVVLG